jgi:transcriptional regulator with XRE-family HTH domain
MNASTSFGESLPYTLHNVRMVGNRKIDKERGKRVRYIRKDKLGLRAQEELAAMVAAETGEPLSRGAVGNWEQGKEIGLKNMRALARIAHVPLEWISDNAGDPTEEPPSADSADQKMSPVVGYVGAGAAAHYYAVSQGELDYVPAPRGAGPNTVAVEIKGDSIGPLFNRWLIFYDDVRSPVTMDLIGRLCVVGLINDLILVKLIKRSKHQDRYDLFSNSEKEPVMEGVEVTWAARVKHMGPR